MRNVPGVVGGLLVVLGAAWLVPALGVIVAGVLLLALDRRL